MPAIIMKATTHSRQKISANSADFAKLSYNRPMFADIGRLLAVGAVR